MPHADSSLIPEDVKTKSEFYAHVHAQLLSLLEGSRYWVSNLAQTSALLYHAYLSSPLYGYNPSSSHTPLINWVGFYHYPLPSQDGALTLGPFNGRPACVRITPKKGKGVCADSFVSEQTLVVPDVEAYPGHIACDGETKSEIVVPLVVRVGGERKAVGVFDLDSTGLSTFDEDDRRGLERILEIVAEGSEWP